MGKYCRLTREERYQIDILKRSGEGVRSIARKIGRSPSTVSSELKRLPEYDPNMADEEAAHRRRYWQWSCRKIRGGLEEMICSLLKEAWSPEQIAGRMKLEWGKRLISHQTIYRYIERDHRRGGGLRKKLRILRKQRKDRKKAGWHPQRVALPRRTMISDRPKIVEERIRLGDYERDLMLGKVNGSLLLTLVDRKSRFVKIGWMPKKNAELTHQTTVSLLKEEIVKTITNDNGSEFARHPETAKALNAEIYFSYSYRAWERGTNENTNGLLRQFFPRKQDIGTLTSGQIKRIEDLLNNRPRKCLGYQTPLEVHKGIKRQVFR